MQQVNSICFTFAKIRLEKKINDLQKRQENQITKVISLDDQSDEEEASDNCIKTSHKSPPSQEEV